jgi:hypothetical protein
MPPPFAIFIKKNQPVQAGEDQPQRQNPIIIIKKDCNYYKNRG